MHEVQAHTDGVCVKTAHTCACTEGGHVCEWKCERSQWGASLGRVQAEEGAGGRGCRAAWGYTMAQGSRGSGQQ